MDILENIADNMFATAKTATESIEFARKRIAAYLPDRGFKRDVAGESFEEIVDALAEAEHDGIGVFIWGRAGVGKTFLARCAFPSAPVVRCSQIGEGFDGFPSGKVVIVDDLGAERQVYGREPILQAFLGWYDRPRHERPRLVITTNLPADEIRQRYGERFSSRARATLVKIHMRGADNRNRADERMAGGVDAASTDPEVLIEFRKYRTQVEVSGWQNVNAGVWALHVAASMGEPKGRAAARLIVQDWERERDRDPGKAAKLKWLADSQDAALVEKHERGVREFGKGACHEQDHSSVPA